MSQDYPFTPSQKLFEQNGWLKAELEVLRSDMVREADLLKLEKRLEAFIISRDEGRAKVLMGELDRAFERVAYRARSSLSKKKSVAVQEKQAKEFEESLIKAGFGAQGRRHALRQRFTRSGALWSAMPILC